MEDEVMIKMEIESEEFQTEAEPENQTNQNTNDCSSKDSDCELLIPKIEPIDVDDDSQNNDQVTDGQMTNKTHTSAPHLVGILNQPTKSQNGPTLGFPKYSMSQISATSTITTSTMASSSATPSKISVVSPTILMPPTAVAGQTPILSTAQSPRPMRIGGNLQALLTTSGPRQTVTGSNGMKFILVNTGDHRVLPMTTTNLPPMPSTTPSPTQSGAKNVHHQQTQQSPQSQKRKASTTPTSQTKSTHLPKSKKRLTDSFPDRDTLRRREMAGNYKKTKLL